MRLKALSERFNLSEHYIGKFFKAHTGKSLQDYILQCRISAVSELLLHTDLRVKEIAIKTGFTDESHLTRLFKRSTSCTPLEYRKQHLQQLPAGQSNQQ